uniref:Multiple inositol polyphosphate phosphatase 1 n=1 Tax=Biomphalaria glabrata TaxID=6526 RepID=A0A2C9LTD2_BIOGL
MGEFINALITCSDNFSDKFCKICDNNAFSLLTFSFTKGQFFFGHAETLGPLYCALGLFNDSMPLRANNYEQHGHRSFLTSNILPFSANLMFVLYECFSDEFQETDEVDEVEYYLKLFVNEKPHQIPGCPELFCPYRAVRERYSSLVDHCDFKQICKRKPAKDEL